MAQDYDKIIKELLRETIIPFMSEVLGQAFKPVKNIDPKMQKTIEREPDFFKIVQRQGADDLEVLHVEWQLKGPWKKVRNRMMLYKVLGITVTDLPVQQYVIYMGKRKPQKTVNTFKDAGMDYRYQLIPIKQISYKTLLNAKETNVALFSILANFEGNSPAYILGKISERMLKDAKGELDIERWQRQLEIISNIHNLQDITIKILERMPIIYNLKKDIRFQQGREEGKEEGIEQGLEKGIEEGIDKQATITIINMLIKTDFTVQQIAELAAVDTKRVQKWQKMLEKVTAKKIWASYKNKKLTPQLLEERSKKLVIALGKIKALAPAIIAKVTDLAQKEVQQILTTQRKNAK
ncbi:MAG: hypothetical protein AAF960_00450 [Bacteroidota bacterium]